MPNIRDVKIVDQPFNGHVIDGSDFNLTCQINRDPSTLIKTIWYHPNMQTIQNVSNMHHFYWLIILQMVINIYRIF